MSGSDAISYIEADLPGVHRHFPERPRAETALRDAGFASARVVPAQAIAGGQGEAAHILEASTTDRGRR